MKILEIVPYFTPYHGGQERYIHYLSKYLVRSGNEVEVVTSNFPLSQESEMMDGVQISRQRCICRLLRNPITPGLFLLGDKVRDYDIIHTHNEHSSAALAAYHYKKRTGIPLVLTVHGRLVFGEFAKDIIEKWYSRTVGRKILQNCNAVVVNSEDDRQYIASVAPKIEQNIVTFHNAVDPEFFDSIPTITVDTQPDQHLILFVGRLIRRKGIEWLIKAIRIIADEGRSPGIKCIIIGEGEDSQFFEKLVNKLDLSQIVEFKGQVGHKELKAYYQSASVFVLPSLSEVCPTVVLEAMYFGLPVVSTDIPGIRDHFKDVAALVPPRDQKRLAEAILAMLDDQNRMQQLSIKGKELVRNQYMWAVVAGKYERLFDQILAR